MAYSESTVGGNVGGSFRVWVNSIRTYDGGPNENFEEWRAEGGLNRVSSAGGNIFNNYSNSSYTLQLGLNGMAASGNFSYNFNTATGTKLAWGTGTTRVYRDGAGNGFGFQSRMDINLQNSPFLTSGWVTSNDGLITRPRHAVLTGLSMDAGGIVFTDETQSWVDFSNPSGGQVDAFIDIYGYGRLQTDTFVGSRHYMQYDAARMNQIQQASPNSNSYTLNIGIIDHVGGGDTYDFRVRTGYIANGSGQANPLFSNFVYADTNATTVAITGNDQVLIQGKSTLQTTVSVANKATARKFATMNYYNYSIGGYSQNSGYSSSSDIVWPIGLVSDVTGTQNLAVRAIDSRGNSATVSKPLTILPYSSPVFVPSLKVSYSNNFDISNGIQVSASGSTIASIAPMTLSGADKNAIVTNGIKFDVSKEDNLSYTGTPVNIPWTQDPGTGAITTDLTNLGSAIVAKINGMLPDNTKRWYINFEIQDKLETKTYETFIDIGKPIFRIGTDNKVYNNEEQLLVIPQISVLADDAAAAITSGTGTITPFVVNSLFVHHGTGVGNSSTVVFNVDFSFYITSAGGMRTWALKIDGNPVGDADRKFFVNQTSVHVPVSSTVVAKGLAAGIHTVTLEIYGSGNDVRTDAADYCTIVATEYANAYLTASDGPKYATVVVDDGGGGNAWVTPSNAEGSPDGVTTYVLEGPGGGGGFPNQLVSSGHGFSIPSGATINGIVLEANVFGYSGASDNVIQVGRTGKMSTATPDFGQSWFGSGGQTWLRWGNSSSLWGRSDWTAADINSSSFGASISAYASHATSNDSVDSIRITVYYI